MPAGKVNYIILYETDPQVYGCASKEIALSTPPPKGYSLTDKRIYFITVEPDNKKFVWHRLPQDEVESAELKAHKKKSKTDDE